MHNLTSAQQNIWNLQKYYEGSTISAICGAVYFKGKIDTEILKRAVNHVIEHQNGLRLRFCEVNGKAMQRVEEYQYEKIPFLQVSDKEALRQYILQHAQKLTGLTDRPLYYFAIFQLNGQIGIVTALSHLISDAWTLSLITRQISDAYEALTQGALRDGKVWDYLEHVHAEEEYHASIRYEKDADYWRDKYPGKPEETAIKPSAAPAVYATVKRVTRALGCELTELAAQFCRETSITPAVLFETVITLYLSKINPENKAVTIGTLVLGRYSAREKNTAGMFISTLPLTIPVSASDTVEALANRITDSHRELFRHQRYPYSNILRQLREKDDFTGNLYDVMFSYQNAQTGIDAETEWFSNGYSEIPLAIHIDNRDNGSSYTWTVDYQAEVFRHEAEIRLIIDRLEHILRQIITNYKVPTDKISIIPDAEYQRIMFDFNDTAADYPGDKCVHTLFEEQVERMADKTAVIACDRTLTYRELNEQANRIAHSLIDQGVKPGDIVAFALPRRSYLIATMFGILKAGAAYLPIDPDYPQDRINYMLEDSKAAYLITEETIQKLLKNEDIADPMLPMTSDSLCYCIYTSGSTGRPKGTLLRHRGIVNLVTNLSIYHDLSKCKRIGFMTTITFDVATQEIFTALLNGFTGVLVAERRETSTEEIISRIQEDKIDVIYATPTYLDALTDSTKKAEKLLAAVKVICLAGEKFYLNHHALSLKDQYPIAFENQYGPAETHVTTATTMENYSDITIGKPIANIQIYILDAYRRVVPTGVTGELCIAGDGVGAGYLNSPELTAEKFIDNPFGEGKLYKTGDLAYWREDGNIVYVGRNDFQVKIRGLRIELGEIENAMQSVDGITQAVVVVRKNKEGRQLICAFYTGDEISAKDIRSQIEQRLPKYMLPHIFTHLDEMPLTSSGKVNRKALPEADLSAASSTVEYAAPKTEQEIVLCAAAQSVLHVEKAGTLDSFFDLGGDSLKAIELIAALEQNGYSTEIKAVFASDTLGELAEHLTTPKEEQEVVIPTGPVPATDAQVRVYTAQAMAGGTAYNVPYAFRVKQLDPARLQAAVPGLIARHESLRTRFENRDGQIMQIVEDSAERVVETLDSGDISAFIRPFDLEIAPLLRVGYYQNTVMVDIHHIITDGGSMPVFLRELNELYMGRTLGSKPVQYREFAVQAHDYGQSEQYWLSVYADEPPVLELNTDHPRQSKQTFSGAALYDTLPGSLHAQICEKCKTMGITPYAFYMGAFYVLLSKFSGNEDIVVGVPASGRSGKFLNSIGMFVNTMALRGRPEGDKTTTAFLHEIREMTVQALDHQDYPYRDLVKKLNIHAENRNPLFDVMFAYQSEKMADVVFGDELAELLPVPVTASKYDITLNVLPRQEDVVLMAEYCVDLYEERTLHRLVGGYKQILTQMLDGEKRLQDIYAVTDAERQRLLYEFNNTEVDYPRSKCVHTLFEEQVARTPDRTAVVACDRTLTYQELNEQANRIAHSLIDRGVKPGNIVAFALPRRSYLIATMFGILKAGAAYLPIDPDYPKERIDYMLEDSKAAYLITEANIQEFLKNKDIADPMLQMASDSLCYCIYTSGSTGKPKGTLLTHENVANYTSNNNNNVVHAIIREEHQTIVSVTTVGFDIFVTESMLPLVNGMTILFANEEQAKIQTALNVFLQQNPADVMQTTPTKMRTLIADPNQCEYLVSLKTIILGGEALDSALVTDLSKLTSARIFNIYGPTETTVWSTNTEVQSADDITIGKPIANTQIHILDKQLQLVPIGVTGQVCIAGDGVGAGYLNRPELTAEKFIDNPFGEGKLYKTGDLAYWREDGNIVYVGRNDFQVKIRGLRIELGEIENAMQSVDGIVQAVVVVRKNGEGRQLICAFYTGDEISAKDIRSQIGQRLPKYMLPHIFMRLDEMPLTSSGKVNRKALPEVDLSVISSMVEYAAPVGEFEKRLASLMEQALNYSPIGRNNDFFDLGCDSLKAIEFLSKAHGEGIYFDLQNVFDYPTIESLCSYLQNIPEKKNPFAPEQFEKYAPILEQNVWDENFIPNGRKLGTVFLTGSTGFLGAHILDALMKHGAQKIYCLVRGGEERLAQRLQYYFGEQYAGEIGKTIIPIVGDLVSEDNEDDWPERVEYVIHAAASVKHYGTWQYFKQTNVDATARVLAYAQKINAKLVYVSTASVSGNSLVDQFDGYVSEEEKHFYESSLYIEQSLDNVYIRSKFEAETLVLDAMLHGLHANIVRMGNLTNRVSDLKFQPNYADNAFLKRIKAILDLGCLPEYPASAYAEFTPVDAAAEAVVKITEYMNDRYTVFHVYSNRNLYFDRMLTYLTRLGHPLTVLSGAEFAGRIQATLNTAHEYIFEALSNQLNLDDMLQFDSNIHIENSFTVQYLRNVGFEWPEIDYVYIEGYLQYFEKLGYIGGVVHDAE